MVHPLVAQVTHPILHYRHQKHTERLMASGKMETIPMIRLLLVDDQPAVRRGLRMRLALEADFLVAGEAEDGVSALALMSELRPDVVVMDAQMPRMDGIIATVALRAAFPEAAVVILSLHDDVATRKQAAAAGATAFLSKHAADTALVDVLRRAVARQRP
jgi:DNA-binding NarL/FixJ family response regulator